MSSNSADSWGEPTNTDSTTRKAAARDIKDDWEDSDEEEQDSQAVWNRANLKAPPAPMPAIAPSSHLSHVHQGAFEPKMRILKRPTPSPTASNNTPSPSTTPDLQTREASYKAARDRIFASDSAPVAGKQIEHNKSSVIRNPKGPPALHQGFNTRPGAEESQDTSGQKQG